MNRVHRWSRLAVLLGWCGCLIFLLASRAYLAYIRAAYAPLGLLAFVVLALFALNRRPGETTDLSPAAAAVFIAPLLLALVVRPAALTTAAAANRGVSTAFASADANAVENLLARVETEGRYRRMTLKQLLSLTAADPRKADGLPVAVEGMVYRGADGAGDFTLVRFYITCCAADASPLGVAVGWDRSDTLAPDAWVVVRGTVSFADGPARIEADEVVPVQMPANPYLY